MGWITFEDGIAYSRNVVAAKVALGLGDTIAASSAMLYDMWRGSGTARKTGIDVAGEVGGIVRDPAIQPWREIDLANGAFGQGVAVTPIQLATAYAAMMNGGTRIQPHVVQAVGDRRRPSATRAARVIDAGRSSKKLVGMMAHVIDEVPFYRDRTLVPGYHVGGKTGTAQIWDPKANDGQGGWKHNLFNYSFVGYIGRQKDVPDLVVAVRIEEGKPTVARVGRLEMPVMSFELFRRIATDAITTPDLLTDRRPRPSCPGSGPVSGPYATLATVTDVDPSTLAPLDAAGAGPHSRRPPSPDRRPAARALRTTDPRRRCGLPPRRSRASCSWHCPGERTDGHAHLAEAIAPGRGGRARDAARPDDAAALGDVTVIRVANAPAALGAVAAGWRRRFDPLVVGITGEHRQDLDQGGGRRRPRRRRAGRCGPRATRTTRSGCR